MNNTYSHAPRASRISSMLRRLAGVAIALAAGITVSGAAQAANAAWPQKPVSVVVPFPAGGSTDTIARMLAPPLNEKLGQPFVIDNRPRRHRRDRCDVREARAG